MDTSILIARLFAVVYLAFALGLLFSGDYYRKELSKIMEDSSYKLWGGFMALVVGFLIVTYHGEWGNDWTVLVTLFGWLALVKGALLLVFPNSLDFFKPMLKADKINTFVSPLVLVMAIVFTYFGFFA